MWCGRKRGTVEVVWHVGAELALEHAVLLELLQQTQECWSRAPALFPMLVHLGFRVSGFRV